MAQNGKYELQYIYIYISINIHTTILFTILGPRWAAVVLIFYNFTK